MKLAFSSNAFRRYTLADAIRIIASAGFQGIEIMADVPHAYPPHLSDNDILEILRILEENRLEISNINAFMLHAIGDTYHPSWTEKDPVLRQMRVEYTLGCIDLANRLGAATLSTEPGGPMTGGSRQEELRLFFDGLEKMKPRAQTKGVRILIEPEPGLLIENSREFREFFQWLDPAVFGLNFDIGHFFCVGEDPVRLIRELKECIHHFHLEDIAASREHHHLMPGQGAIDLPRVLEAIDSIGYSGFVTVELYTYEDHAQEATEQAFAYLQRIMP